MECFHPRNVCVLVSLIRSVLLDVCVCDCLFWCFHVCVCFHVFPRVLVSLIRSVLLDATQSLVSIKTVPTTH